MIKKKFMCGITSLFYLFHFLSSLFYFPFFFFEKNTTFAAALQESRVFINNKLK